MVSRRAVTWGAIAVLALAVSSFVYAGVGASWSSSSGGHDHAGTTFNVTFTESGLPAGTNWTVEVFGHGWGGFFASGGFQRSGNASIVFALPNGSYGYRVGFVRGYEVVSGSHGTFQVNNSSPAAIAVDFAVLPTYTVTFTETGLAAGTNWSVQVVEVHGAAHGPGYGPRSQRATSSTSSITFALPNGTYRYEVRGVPGYVLQNGTGHGRFNVSGAPPAAIAVDFAVPVDYTVTFTESGLPSATNWTVIVVGGGGAGKLAWNGGRGFDLASSNTTTITVSLTNGSYRFFVGFVHNYTASANGTGGFVVAGAPAPSVSVTFVATPSGSCGHDGVLPVRGA